MDASSIIQLGQTVKDKLTGFTGLVTGRCEYISGCHQILIQPPVKGENEFVEPHWLDEERVETLPAATVSLKTVNPGFDMEAPKR
jgi:hypothetical protein